MEGSRERGLGGDPLVAQPRQPAQQHVDLDLGAFGEPRSTLETPPAQQTLENGRSDAAQHEASAQALRVVSADLDLAVGADRGHLGVGAQFGPGTPGGALQLGADAAHSADGNIPVPGAAADHVVEEAAVLSQARVVR